MDKGRREPNPRGRPALPPGKGKRHAVGIRTTKELKDQLQRSADSAGRSLAQEIEMRLEQSFDWPVKFRRLALDFIAAYAIGREASVVRLLLELEQPDEQERWRRYQTLENALLTYKANHPFREIEE